MTAKILLDDKQTIRGSDITEDGWYNPNCNSLRILFIRETPAIAVNVDSGSVVNITSGHSWFGHEFIYCPEFKIEL